MKTIRHRAFWPMLAFVLLMPLVNVYVFGGSYWSGLLIVVAGGVTTLLAGRARGGDRKEL